MKIDKKLLPVKGHFILYNAGTAPLIPYLSTYARQLGFSSTTVGLIYSVLPIFSLIATLFFGLLADRYTIQKSIFVFFQIVVIVSFGSIYFIPQIGLRLKVELDCGNGATVIKSCYKNADEIDQYKVMSLGNHNSTTECKMTCDLSSPKMWQTVCEHWHIPKYCYSHTNSINYTATISNIRLKEDNCTYIEANNVTLEGYSFKPSCRIGDGFVDVNEPCDLTCMRKEILKIFDKDSTNMTCSNDTLNYRICGENIAKYAETGNIFDMCQAQCELDTSAPWKLMEICLGWDADVTNICKPKSEAGEHLPKTLTFTGSIRLSSTITEHSCVFMRLNNIVLPDDTVHYPNCLSKTQYEMEMSLFHPLCDINCDHPQVNELIQLANGSTNQDSYQYTKKFWIFLILMILTWTAGGIVVTFADAICINLLGSKHFLYGKQRLWGSVGFGLLSLISGSLIDMFSDGAYKNYSIAFILMFVFMCGDVVVSSFLEVKRLAISFNIVYDVGTFFKSVHNCVFMLWAIAIGSFTGLLWQFLFWHIEDVARLTDGDDYVKTLQGLVSATQTFVGEISFMFLSGYMIKKIGLVNMMSLVLLAFGVRFVLYSFLTNAWWVLPVELFQGVTFGMFYPTMTMYANIVSPPGTETTVHAIVGAIFGGIGTSLGSVIGGHLYQTYKGWNTFRWFGFGAFIVCFVHVIAQYLIKNKTNHNQGYASVIHYGHNKHAVKILDEDSDSQ